MLKIPTCRRQPSWLFTKRAGVEFGTTEEKSILLPCISSRQAFQAKLNIVTNMKLSTFGTSKQTNEITTWVWNPSKFIQQSGHVVVSFDDCRHCHVTLPAFYWVARTNLMPLKNIFNGSSQNKTIILRSAISLVWYILKQLFTLLSVKVVDIYLPASRRGKDPPLYPLHYSPPPRWISVNYSVWLKNLAE